MAPTRPITDTTVVTASTALIQDNPLGNVYQERGNALIQVINKVRIQPVGSIEEDRIPSSRTEYKYKEVESARCTLTNAMIAVSCSRQYQKICIRRPV